MSQYETKPRHQKSLTSGLRTDEPERPLFDDRLRDAVAEMLAQGAKNRAPIGLNRGRLVFDSFGQTLPFVSDRALSDLHDKPVTKAFAFIVSGICLNNMMRAVHWA